MNKTFIITGVLFLTIASYFVSEQSLKKTLTVKTYWQQWDRLSAPSKTFAGNTNRKIAQAATAFQCFDTEKTISFLNQHVSLLDKKVPSREREIFKGSLPLKNLTQQESDFLKKYPLYVATLNEDASDCKDVACYFKKVYKSEDLYEGLAIYYFYLDTGYVLSTSDEVPRLAKIAGYDYDKYLFSRSELDNFLYISSKLNGRFKFMKSLNTIHRLPRKMSIASQGNACGLNYSNADLGDIVLMDPCLDALNGRVLPIHEIAHSLDKVLIKAKTFSDTEEWQNFSGWSIKEDKDTAGRITTRTWMNKDGDQYDKFIRSYAATSPAEDFADSVAYFVDTPDKLLQTSPKKFAFIKERIFDGRSFENKGQLAWYSAKMLNSLKDEFPEIMKMCVQDKTQFKSEEVEKLGLDDESLDPELLSCIKGGIEASLTNNIAELAANDLFSCKYFKEYSATLIENTISLFTETLKASIHDNEALARLAIFRDKLDEKVSEEVEPREFVLSCFKSEKPENCYSEKIKNSINTEAQLIENLPEEVLRNYFVSYMDKNSYEETRATSIRMFKSLFDQNSTTIAKWAEEAWSQCLINQTEPVDPLVIPFSGGAQYIEPKILTCLNQKIYNGIDSILTKRAQKLGIMDLSKENKFFLFDLYSPIVFESWQKIVSAASKEENGKLPAKKITASESIIKNLSLDISWLKQESKNRNEFMNDCQIKSEQLLLEKLRADSELTTMKFNTVEQIAGSWRAGICERVIATVVIQKEFKTRNPSPLEVLKKMTPEILDQNWVTIENSCIEKYKKVTNLSAQKTSVKSCMHLLANWQKIVSLTMSDLKGRITISLKDEKDLKAWLETLRASSELSAINRAISKIK